MNKQEIAAKLKEFRLKHKLSLYQISKSTGLAINQIKAIELDLKCNSDSFLKVVQFYTQSNFFSYKAQVEFIIDVFTNLHYEQKNELKAIKHTTWSDAVKEKVSQQ